jgi:hypothetical protein
MELSNEHPVPDAGTTSDTDWAVFGPGSGPPTVLPPPTKSAESAGQRTNPFMVVQLDPFPSRSIGTVVLLPEKVSVNFEGGGGGPGGGTADQLRLPALPTSNQTRSAQFHKTVYAPFTIPLANS